MGSLWRSIFALGSCFRDDSHAAHREIYLSNFHYRGAWMLTRMIVMMWWVFMGFGALLAYLASLALTVWRRWQRSRFLR